MLKNYFVIFLKCSVLISIVYCSRNTSRSFFRTRRTKATMSQQTPKLKILCLHGMGQNGIVFRNKTGSLRKRLSKLADMTYIDAPFIVENVNNAQLEDIAQAGEQRSWFDPQEDRYSANVNGFKQGFDTIEKALKENENGPFDGILGFSQGAEILGLICCLKIKNMFQSDFRFAIFISGFKSHCPFYKDIYPTENLLSIPSLHIMGETDQIIVKEKSELFSNLFNESSRQKITHPGGHYVPGNADIAVEVKEFLNKQKDLIETNNDKI